MNNKISIKVVGYATGFFLIIAYLSCIVFDLIFPEHAMYKVWAGLLPGFEWLNLKSFLIGLVEVFLYGWFIAIVWVPLYNYFGSRTAN